MKLVIMKDVVKEVHVLVSSLRQAMNVIQAVQHQTHGGMGDLILTKLIPITTETVRTYFLSLVPMI